MQGRNLYRKTKTKCSCLTIDTKCYMKMNVYSYIICFPFIVFLFRRPCIVFPLRHCPLVEKTNTVTDTADDLANSTFPFFNAVLLTGVVHPSSAFRYTLDKSPAHRRANIYSNKPFTPKVSTAHLFPKCVFGLWEEAEVSR